MEWEREWERMRGVNKERKCQRNSKREWERGGEGECGKKMGRQGGGRRDRRTGKK